jgi:hypothetical protein
MNAVNSFQCDKNGSKFVNGMVFPGEFELTLEEVNDYAERSTG